MTYKTTLNKYKTVFNILLTDFTTINIYYSLYSNFIEGFLFKLQL